MSAERDDEPRDRRPDSASSASGAAAQPRASRKDRLRPAELVGFSAILGVFTGLVVLTATREPLLALVAFGIAFIVALVALAMFSLAFHADEPPADGEDYKTKL